jgi:hypothetical protein
MLVTGPLPVYYTITTTPSPSTAGKATGAGTFLSGLTKTVKATAKLGYRFVDWTEGGFEVSTTPNYTFTLTGDRALVANFVKVYTVATAPNSVDAGSTIGDGTYDSGSSVTLEATANPGYAFVSWTLGLAKVSTNPVYTFTITGNRSYVANFAKLYTISSSASPSNGGSVSGGGTVKDGSTVTLKAKPRLGWHLVNWTESGTEVSTATSYFFVVSGDRTLTANFAKN